MSHLKYLNYVIRHKWFVFLAGRKTGAPLWRLIIHDWSKFSRAEWGPYVRTFYVLPGKEQDPLFDYAWNHHQHKNPHHWQHWLLQEDNGPLKRLEMPPDLVREMVADWMGAGRAITGKWDVVSWYNENYNKIQLSTSCRQQVDGLIEKVTGVKPTPGITYAASGGFSDIKLIFGI
jgi:hypothetical protein